MKTDSKSDAGLTACICCNGELRGTESTMRFAGDADLLIAADGGSAHLASMGLKPDVIIGDMDSFHEDPWPGDVFIRRIIFSADKDRSDGELAVQWALEQGAGRILLLGVWGGRIDHTLGNSVILMRYPGRVAAWDDGFLVQALSGGQRVELPNEPACLVSMFPLEEGTRVKTTGLRYALEDEALDHATHGLSNTATSENFSVAVTKGLIFLCVKGGAKWLEK